MLLISRDCCTRLKTKAEAVRDSQDHNTKLTPEVWLPVISAVARLEPQPARTSVLSPTAGINVVAFRFQF